MQPPTLAQIFPSAFHNGVLRIGGDDTRQTKQILLALYTFLADKPPNTRRTYRTGLQLFFDVNGWKDPKLVTTTEAASYKRWLLARDLSNSTICVRLAAVDGFFEFLTKQRVIPSNPFAVVSRKDVLPGPTVQRDSVAWQKFKAMLDGLPGNPVGMRNKAVLIFAAYTGCRVAEIANLRVCDLDLTSKPRMFSVTRSGKVKRLVLPQVCYDAIRAHWISADRLKRMTAQSAVFAPIRSCALTQGMDPERTMDSDMIYFIIRQAAKAGGLDPSQVPFRSLRRVTDVDKAQAQRGIQRFLGSAQPTAAATYLQALRGPGTQELEKVRGAAITIATPLIESDDDAPGRS